MEINQKRLFFGSRVALAATGLLIALLMSVAVTSVLSEKAEAVTTYDISKGTMQLSATNYTYTGYECRPSVTVTYNGQTVHYYCYDVTYRNNVNAGTATVIVTGDPYYSYSGINYTGTLSKTFVINRKALGNSNLFVSNTYYNGKKRTPSMSVYDSGRYLVKGRDYTVQFLDAHRKIGKHTVVVNFKGNYTGKAKKKFKILPKTPTIRKTKTLSTTSISARWSKVKGVTGYKVYRYNSKKGKYYPYTTTKSTSCVIRKAKSYDQSVSFYVRAYKKIGGKTFYSESDAYGYEHVKLSKVPFTIKKTGFRKFEIRVKTSGYYQVQVCSNRGFSGRNVYPEFRSDWEGYIYESREFSGYSSSDRWYVRVRPYYYNKQGNLRVGPWSNIKSVVPY